jgi:hypothetical protein
MKPLACSVAAVFLLAGACIAQAPTPPPAQQTKPVVARPLPVARPPQRAIHKAESKEDAAFEQAFREMHVAAMKSAHAGPDGRPAPDLRAKGLAHFQRMKVATLADPGIQKVTAPKP